MSVYWAPVPASEARGRSVVAVIAAARERARRRRRFLGLITAVAASVAAVVFFLGNFGGGPEVRMLSPARVFAAQAPYVGIACDLPGCGRVGVAVWLRRCVDSLTASIGGATVELRCDGRDGRVRTYWGYLHLPPAQLRQPVRGQPRRSFVLHLRVQFRGAVAERTVRVPLHPGWG